MASIRNRNDGIRKLCDCARRTWAKCPHPWHFNFKWAGEVYRFSLERQIGAIVKDADGKWRRDRAALGERIADKGAAVKERDRLRAAIRDGTMRGLMTLPQRDTLTLAKMMDAYRKQHLAVHRPTTLKNLDYMIAAILGTALDRADGETRRFGAWLVADITTDVIEQYRAARRPHGITGTNRHLEVLRSLFNWAASSRRKLVTDNPFLDGARAAVRLAQELPRRRRLYPGEGQRLLAACGPQLRALVEAAIETGCRRGELLSLQWHQVRFAPRAELFLPAVKTKTKQDRTVPISTRLRNILEMRRNAPDGTELPPHAYVFGNEVGEPVSGFKRAWQTALLRAHGHKPQYVVRLDGTRDTPRKVYTAALTAQSREALRQIDLHFHDLRREAGSRWLDAGVPLHRIQKWLGHANIAQTSTYLMADSADDDHAMRRFEAHQARLQQIATDSETGAQTPPLDVMTGNTETQNSSVKHH